MRNIKLTVAYDGTGYHGFQEQRGTGLPTVQGKIENCLSSLAGRKIQVIGASRTDAGVHAHGQVINFNDGGWNIPIEKVGLALNCVLPDDIAVLDCKEVSCDFHARFSTVSKEYRYSVFNFDTPDPFRRRYSYFIPKSLDVESIRSAASILQGKHDFSAFMSSGCKVTSTVRTIFDIRVDCNGNLVELVFKGDGFLYNMVRIMAGTLLDVGLGKYPPAIVSEILASKDRKRAGPTVPPQGLYLIAVFY